MFDWITFFTHLAIIVGLVILFVGMLVAYCCSAMSSRISQREEGYDEEAI